MSTKSSTFVLMQKFARLRRMFGNMAVEAMRPMGLGTLQAGMVLRLEELGTASSAELAKLMHVDPAAIGHAVDTLILKGWITQVDDPADRRKWRLSLTPKGAKKLPALRKVNHNLAERFFAGLKARDRATFFQLLNKIETAFLS